MNDAERLDQLDKIAQEVEVKIRVDYHGDYEVQIGRVTVLGETLRGALDAATDAAADVKVSE
jgi:hypothetical protein